MTTRERFRRVMAGDAAVDRLPAIEWAYWWDKTLELWYGQGLPRGLDEAAMADFVGIDRNTQFWLPHKTPDCPRETSHGRGIVENESDYERLRPYLLPENAVQQMLPKIRQTLPFYENGQTLVWYTLDGFFWWPRTLLGIENHLYSFYDQPELYHKLPKEPQIDTSISLWKGALKPLAAAGFIATFAGLIYHYIGIGPNKEVDDDEEKHDE